MRSLGSRCWKDLNSQVRFREAFLKAWWGRGSAGGVIGLCTVLWLADGSSPVSQGVTGSGLRLQLGWGLHAHCRHVVNFFHLVEVSESVKQLTMCIKYYYLCPSGWN